ncbi:hypothetical protein, partial [Mesonia mobilis]|uniref:hypothetical protein n=1 Tax=Mesonia mobilis TaxID=369791 RepID=UPI0024B98374
MLNLIQHLILKETEFEIENIVVLVSKRPVSNRSVSKTPFRLIPLSLYKPPSLKGSNFLKFNISFVMLNLIQHLILKET